MYRSNWKTLIIPREVKIVDQDDSGKYAKFACEPLMKGFGITLGNSLRRILLSSLMGAAVVGVKIKGVEHEFSTIPGVREDVIDIILNIKQIRFKLFEDKLHSLVLKRNSAGVVVAGDIEDTAGIKILNKDLKLFEMEEGVDFEMELLITSGRGYVPAEQHDSELFSEGFIAVDSFFSPVTKVNYKITGARVKNNFNFDKLTMDIETDGSVSPRDALAFAAMILMEHTKFLVNFTIEEGDDFYGSDSEEEANMDLYKTIEDLDLSVRSKNCLVNAEIKYVGELVAKTEGEMLRTKNFGRKSLNEIKILLKNMGLHLGMDLGSFPDAKILEQIEKKNKE